MAATRFMRIPFFVTGYRVTHENMDAIATWCEGRVVENDAVDRPFVRVPVDRATSKKQTEAYVGMWVILSTQRGERSFKVYTQEWLKKQFFELPDDELIDEGIPEVLSMDADLRRRHGESDARPVLPTQARPTAENPFVAPRTANG